MQVISIGLDIAKRVFQVHGIDSEGAIVVRRKLKRSQLLDFFDRLAPCLVGIEACAKTHHWARASPSRLPSRIRWKACGSRNSTSKDKSTI